MTRPARVPDRAIFLNLGPIPEERRRPEKELWAAFEKIRPQILGALLDAVSLGLRRLPDTKLEKLPRMADFALWATACEGVLWKEGTFCRAYAGNRDEAVDSVIEADPVGSAICSMMSMRTEWTGTASDLLGVLAEVAGDRVAKSKTWPNSPRALSGQLRRAATFLRKIGINIDYTKKGRARTRVIYIRATDTVPDYGGAQPSAPSAPSAGSEKTALGNGSSDTPLRTVATPADANRLSDQPTVRNNANDSANADGADGADAKIPTHSAGWRTRI